MVFYSYSWYIQAVFFSLTASSLSNKQKPSFSMIFILILPWLLCGEIGWLHGQLDWFDLFLLPHLFFILPYLFISLNWLLNGKLELVFRHLSQSESSSILDPSCLASDKRIYRKLSTIFSPKRASESKEKWKHFWWHKTLSLQYKMVIGKLFSSSSNLNKVLTYIEP